MSTGYPASQRLPEGIDQEYFIRHPAQFPVCFFPIFRSQQVFQDMADENRSESFISKGHIGHTGFYGNRNIYQRTPVNIHADVSTTMCGDF